MTRPTLLIGALLVVACAAPEGETAAPAGADAAAAPEIPGELVIEGLVPLISDADIDLALPAAIDVDGDGNVWIADRSLHHVLVVSPEGEVLHTIGRNGGGPGEFRGPRGVGIRGDRAYVLDIAHGVQVFDMRADYLGEYTAPRVFFDFDFTGDGGLVASNNRVWARGGLVLALGPEGEERGVIGEPPFAGAEGFNFRGVREAILGGSIPDVARNGALPIAAPDGSLWVVVHTEALLRRYGADGALLFETRFELPELPAIEAQYYEDFRDAPSADTFFFPSFVADGVAMEDSLLLLWDTVEGSPGLITVHDATGAIAQRWVLPELDMGGGGFTILSLAIDATRRRLYVSVSDIATIFGVDLPEQGLPF